MTGELESAPPILGHCIACDAVLPDIFDLVSPCPACGAPQRTGP